MLSVAVVVKKPPPYSAELYSSLLPVTGSDRTTSRYVSNGLSSTQYSDWSSVRNTSDRYVHGLPNAGLSLDWPSRNYAGSIPRAHTDSGLAYSAPYQSGVSSYNLYGATSSTGRSAVVSRPMSSIGISSHSQHPITPAPMPRSYTSHAYLSTSSSGTQLAGSYGRHRPLSSDSTSVQPSSRRTFPHTAHRM